MTKSTKSLPATIAVQIPTYWTPEQAFAVVELIDDLRDAIWQSYSVQLLGDLAALDSDSALRRRLRHYARPDLLAIDEVGYLSYSNRHADLLFELVSRRYERKSTLITTNRPFAEWRQVFPNAVCVVSLVDRLVHNAEILAIEGESYRLKEAQERADQRARQRRKAKS